MNELFSSHRLWLLIRGAAIRHYRALAVISSALTILIFITSIMWGGGSAGFYLSWFGVILFVWGALLSSRAFLDMHDKTRNQAYLLVPASSLEKTLAEWFRVTIGFVLYLLALVFCASVLAEVTRLIFYGFAGSVFNPFQSYLWELISKYLFIQSFFFLGAAWFRKHHLAKTILATGLVILMLMLLFWLSIELFGLHYEHGFRAYQMAEGPMKTWLQVLLPIAFCFVAWLRVKEVQVSDGV